MENERCNVTHARQTETEKHSTACYFMLFFSLVIVIKCQFCRYFPFVFRENRFGKSRTSTNVCVIQDGDGTETSPSIIVSSGLNKSAPMTSATGGAHVASPPKLLVIVTYRTQVRVYVKESNQKGIFRFFTYHNLL